MLSRKHEKMEVVVQRLPHCAHKMLILLNFAQKSLSFHPNPLAFGRIFTHGLLTGTGPQLPGELVHDCLDAGVSHAVAEVAGFLAVPGVVNIQVERVEAVTVRHHGVKHTEPLTLLQVLRWSK